VSNAAFSPDGKTVITASYDGTARLWDATSGQPRSAPMRHSSFVIAVAFSRDGRLAVTGSDDGTARIWDAVHGRPIGPALYHPGKVKRVAFSPDGTTILTGCDDATARLWTLARPTREIDSLSPWLETLTGLELNDQRGIIVLDADAWTKHRQSLDTRTGLPNESSDRSGSN
jgi:WD40 repeat protein